MKIKQCSYCSKEFKVKPSHFERRKNCSLACYNKVKKGRYIPNSGQFKKGEHPSSSTEFKKGFTPHNKDKKGAVNSGSFKNGHDTPFKGENHYNWQDGKSFEPYGVEFNNKLKEQVRERDKRTCQECYYHEQFHDSKLDIHHIDYNKKNNSPNNLISLCRSCHAQTNFSREDWTQYFERKTV